jgi:hypothetical protein
VRADLRLRPWSPPSALALPGLVAVFARTLREAGLGGDATSTADAIRSTRLVDVRDVVQFYQALHANLTSRRQDTPLFDEAFATFWLRGRAGTAEPLGDEGDRPAGAAAGDERERPEGDEQDGEPGRDGGAAGDEAGLAGAEPGGERPEVDVDVVRARYSPQESLRDRDFRDLSAEERALVRRAVEEMPALLRLQRRRRHERSVTARRRIDFRHTFRAALATGEPLPRWRQRRHDPERLVVLLDTSRSMDAYVDPLLAFAHGLCRAVPRTEVFLFSTKTTRVTDLLRSGERARALATAAEAEAARSSGTAMGACLEEFHRRWGAGGLGSHWVTIVASDGWDWGDPRVLAEQMERIRRRSRVVLWLNPMMGDPRFQPLSTGMRAALPSVDALLACHSAAALGEVVARLVLTSGGVPQP